MWDDRTRPQGRRSTVFSRCEIRNAIEAGGAQRPYRCIDDWPKSVLRFWGGQGGSGDTVAEHSEEHVAGGGREGRVSERRGGEEAADEEVAGWEGRSLGKGPRFERDYFGFLYTRHTHTEKGCDRQGKERQSSRKHDTLIPRVCRMFSSNIQWDFVNEVPILN
ncbi:hypothetical protein K443DRAFT_486234 [Laccaria amethystina LaAM-08-1]|uniref:Unplaced genomic scaffold K443scaffold_477, whole genome shotgun sequence n=1 Tax=Laccaria amethystina LaAM-08-1 TaxID=1095629 RepID=A0A0C9WMU2_9AGAR|nr:hypothetical protein K443DRAFT_551640 [Laccaria amethystina LaAM-08-1]KIJ91405.1 hypothetical protein K443DRAFT_486234 [Laccaria amethystina LaAM-08-1]